MTLPIQLTEDVCRFNGGAIEPEYKPPAPYSGPLPTGGPEGAKLYHGSCHCGAVKMALKFQDLDKLSDADEDRVIECNCSSCQRVSRSFYSMPLSA